MSRNKESFEAALKDPQYQALAEEMLEKGRAMAEDKGIIVALPPGVKEVKPDYSPFPKRQESYGACRKIRPWKVATEMIKRFPQTTEEIQRFRNAHAYTDCKLISTSKIGRYDETDDLYFWSNATKWDPITFWHIPRDVPISVPNWVIEHINQTCNWNTLENIPFGQEVLHENVKNCGMSSSGQYLKKPAQQVFRFVELAA